MVEPNTEVDKMATWGIYGYGPHGKCLSTRDHVKICIKEIHLKNLEQANEDFKIYDQMAEKMAKHEHVNVCRFRGDRDIKDGSKYNKDGCFVHIPLEFGNHGDVQTLL